jgi:hypothetical protein
MVYDAALKEKARELFVNSGFTVETILSMLPEISKKTLSNWCIEEDWETQRRSRVVRKEGRRERIEGAIDRILDELDVRTDPKLIFSLGRLIAALKSASTLKFSEEKKMEKKKDVLSDETWNKIDEHFGI